LIQGGVQSAEGEGQVSYRRAVEEFKIREDDNKIVDMYYHDIFAHELKEFEENFTEWETNRIY
jgi:hypothetical protein